MHKNVIMPSFKEAEALNGVAKFHQQFQLPIIDKPAIPSKERCALRINLLQEELDELKEALDNGDLVEAADACADIQYVLSGAILEFGMGGIFSDLFDEAQRSNMSKACETELEAQQTVDHYYQKDWTKAVVRKVEESYLVYRTSDGKVLKSVNYSPADFEGVLKQASVIPKTI